MIRGAGLNHIDGFPRVNDVPFATAVIRVLTDVARTLNPLCRRLCGAVEGAPCGDENRLNRRGLLPT